MARLDREAIDLEKEFHDLNSIIMDAITNINHLLQEKAGKIICEFQSSHSVIRADRLHLTNTLFNLLDNAIKYCEKAPEIRVRTINRSHGITLEVIDNGIGIDYSHHRKIFQKFYRVPTGNIHNVKGFGLGLSYVKKIIAAHGGTISIKSQPSQGSIFRIDLKYE
jgi:two-component system phosphate regulon sensor histidine kinase PhoR